MNLTARQAKFVASYQINHSATESAVNAGYSVKTAGPIGCRLLKNPKIINELEKWRVKKGMEISKPDYVDMALEDYRSLEVVEPNRPRFLEIVGKTLGHLGQNDGKPQQSLTFNQLNINTADSASSPEELWAITRKLLTDI